jgi:ergothioneine biosynthesis protein EgtB
MHIGQFAEVRSRTEALAAPLSPEDQVVQSMPDCSPTKWHRAHTTWFFDEFVLTAGTDAQTRYLWNSYYEAVGDRHPRAGRGLLTRPTCDDVTAYRRSVDAQVLDGMASMTPEQLDLVELGCHHEEQHQELLLMDAKHLLAQNPLRPAYSTLGRRPTDGADDSWGWVAHDGGVTAVGHDGRGFCFDNEMPRHEVLLRPFALADRLVSCGDWVDFIDDGGYRRPELWMADGWATVTAGAWEAPLYWERGDVAGTWSLFTLGGMRAVDSSEPVTHVSWYEADAFARWTGHRLPTEEEWEAVAHPLGAEGLEGSFLDPSVLHPRPPGRRRAGAPPRQLFGEVWQWTASAYSPYPGFQPAAGAVGEYNGKFMVNQHVLRGGSCLTPSGHARTTYRNFFPPAARWASSGVRLATDA